ncbi:hypothetical protein ACNKHV_16860 [Shigella flexneri]
MTIWTNGKLTALFVDGKAVDAINAGQEAVVVPWINVILCGIRWSGLAIKAN